MQTPPPIPGHLTERVNALCTGTSYEPVGFLGAGGMGQIYVVRHRLLDKRFALKAIHPHLLEHASAPERLRIEAQTMARLGHPNIAKVTDFWLAADGSPSFVMELLTGRNLAAELFERTTLPQEEVIAIGCQALNALGASHAVGIVHRDIKPENLFLHEAPCHPRVLKVLDFGVARVLEGAPESSPQPLSVPTRAGARVGSPRFMSPEGRRGEPVDHRADLYSLGLTLYLALVGTIHFEMTKRDALPPPSTMSAMAISPELDSALARALREDPAERYSSAREFLETLERLAPPRRDRASWNVRRAP
ncbi:MAG: serine/threonine-protein kinase [Polyangiaceae bacterium]